MASGTSLGTAYFNIAPNASGIQSKMTQALGGSKIGESVGSSLVSGLKKVIGAAAIGSTISSAIKVGADLEQQLGGVETLYKNSADKVIANANRAWQTAGLSANDYMKQSTTFAAALLSSLGGDTQKAANYANTAIIDMSDNANKMGTDIESIQNAYQGFSKQNYTMLDNLKLGYGGTKTEMERLLADAGKLSGQKYDISSLSDVYSAIHVIQQNLDITGTTAKEAATTVEGSFNSMKSAFTNLLGSLTTGDNVGTAMSNLISSASTFLINNLAPMVGRVLANLPTAIATAIPTIVASIKTLGSQIMSALFPDTDIESTINTIKNAFIGLTLVLSPLIAGLTAYGIALGICKVQGMLYAAQLAVQTAWQTISTTATNVLSAAQSGLNLIMSLNPIALVVIAIAGLVAAIVIAYKKSETFRNCVNFLWTAVKTAFMNIKNRIVMVANVISNVWGGIKAKLVTPITSGVNAVVTKLKNFWTKVKELVQKIKDKFSFSGTFGKKLKFPHISVDWKKSSGLKQKVLEKLGLSGLPSFHVSWYKTGGIFDQASLIGVGEAGAEAVVPLNQFWSTLADYPNQIASALNGGTSGSGELNLIINLDGETIAKSTVNYVNGQTIRYGTSPLNI